MIVCRIERPNVNTVYTALMATPRPRVGSKGTTAMERADTAAKHARVIELRVAGWTLEAIAAELGYADKSGVRYVLDKWVDDHAPTPESIAELRQRMLAQLRSSASRAQIGSHPEVAIEQSYQRLRVARDRPDGGVRPLGRLVKKPRREPRTRPPDAGKFLGIQPEARSISLDEPGQAQSFESSPGVLLHVVLARWRALVQSAEPSRARSTC